MGSTELSYWQDAEAQLRDDPWLGDIVGRVGACPAPPKRPRGLFAALLRAIIYQQLHGKAAASIHARVVALLDNPRRPTAAAFSAIGDEAFRAAGLSRGKLAAIRDLAAHDLRGDLPDATATMELTDEALIERLTVVRGVGPWTVQMVLMFELGRPDVWPVGDLGIRTAVKALWRKRKLPDEPFMQRVGKRWRPWRTVASWYLWQSLELPGE